MSPNVTNLASSILADGRYEALKVAAYEKVKGWNYTDPSNAFGQYMGLMRFFEALEEWSKEGQATKLKEKRAKESPSPTQDRDPDLE